MKKRNIISIALLSGAALATPSFALAKTGDPVVVAEGLTLDPIFDARLAYEHVDQPVTSALVWNWPVISGFHFSSRVKRRWA